MVKKIDIPDAPELQEVIKSRLKSGRLVRMSEHLYLICTLHFDDRQSSTIGTLTRYCKPRQRVDYEVQIGPNTYRVCTDKLATVLSVIDSRSDHVRPSSIEGVITMICFDLDRLAAVPKASGVDCLVGSKQLVSGSNQGRR